MLAGHSYRDLPDIWINTRFSLFIIYFQLAIIWASPKCPLTEDRTNSDIFAYYKWEWQERNKSYVQPDGEILEECLKTRQVVRGYVWSSNIYIKNKYIENSCVHLHNTHIYVYIDTCSEGKKKKCKRRINTKSRWEQNLIPEQIPGFVVTAYVIEEALFKKNTEFGTKFDVYIIVYATVSGIFPTGEHLRRY